MTRKLTTLFAAATVLTGITAATVVFAEEASPRATQPPHAQGMMGNHGGMMNMMGQMSPDQMKLMTSMMEKCNRMMDSVSNAPARTDNEQTPAPHG